MHVTDGCLKKELEEQGLNPEQGRGQEGLGDGAVDQRVAQKLFKNKPESRTSRQLLL